MVNVLVYARNSRVEPMKVLYSQEAFIYCYRVSTAGYKIVLQLHKFLHGSFIFSPFSRRDMLTVKDEAESSLVSFSALPLTDDRNTQSARLDSLFIQISVPLSSLQHAV